LHDSGWEDDVWGKPQPGSVESTAHYYLPLALARDCPVQSRHVDSERWGCVADDIAQFIGADGCADSNRHKSPSVSPFIASGRSLGRDEPPEVAALNTSMDVHGRSRADAGNLVERNEPCAAPDADLPAWRG